MASRCRRWSSRGRRRRHHARPDQRRPLQDRDRRGVGPRRVGRVGHRHARQPPGRQGGLRDRPTRTSRPRRSSARGRRCRATSVASRASAERRRCSHRRRGHGRRGAGQAGREALRPPAGRRVGARPRPARRRAHRGAPAEPARDGVEQPARRQSDDQCVGQRRSTGSSADAAEARSGSGQLERRPARPNQGGPWHSQATSLREPVRASTTPPGAEGWQELYATTCPSATPARDVEDVDVLVLRRHPLAERVHAVRATFGASSRSAAWASTTPATLCPPANGIDYRVHNGYVYMTPVPVADPAEIPARVPQFLERAGHYFGQLGRALMPRGSTRSRRRDRRARGASSSSPARHGPARGRHVGLGKSNIYDLAHELPPS